MGKVLLIIGLSLILLLLLCFIGTYNKIKRLKNKVLEASSGIDVALAKRYSVLTEMIEVVKGYIKHEKSTFVELVKLRSEMTIKEKVEANNIMDQNANKIGVLVEKYPDLKAVDSFVNLQKALVDVEEHLQAARRLYNSNVTLYNNLLESFPSLIVANMISANKQEYFKASDEEKKNVSLEIND